MAELTPEQLNAINDGLREQEQLLAAITSRTQAQQNLLEANRRIQQQVNDALSETRTEREKELAQIQATIKEAERQNRLLQEQVTAIYAAGRANGQLTEQQKDQIRLLEDQIDANNTVASQLEIENELRQDSISVAEGILETTLGISKQQSGVVGLLQKSVNSGKSFGESLRDVGSDLAEGMSEVLTTTNVLASVASKIVESTIMMVQQTDGALANFNEMTSAGGELNQVVFEASLDAKEFGINMQQAVATAGELYTSMSGFTELTTEAQKEVITFTSALTKAGVAAKDTGEILDLAMKGFGMTTAEATDLSNELLATAQAIGVPAGKLASDFNSAMGELTKYGPQGIQVFKELAAQAKAAGVEMGTLMGIAGQFDTIEGAATATSKLNAILGSTMNTMELLNATESERIQLLQESIQASGRSFAEMDRFEKQAIATAAGINDMAEAEKLFAQNASEFGAAANEINGITAAQAELEKVTEAATSMGERFTLIMERMAIAVMPLINLARFLVIALFDIVDVIFTVLDTIGDFIPFTEALTKAMKVLAVGIGILLIPTIYGMATAFGAAVIAAAPFIALGALIIAVLVGIYEVVTFLGEAIVDGFLAGLSLIPDGMIEPFKKGWQSVKEFFGFASPAKAATSLGVGIIEGLAKGLDGMTEAMSQPFEAAFDAIASTFNGYINFLISGINSLIEAMNSINFTVPDWVPFVGGKSYGIDIPLIPMLEEGGQIDKEGAAYLHAGEKVIPAAEVSALDEATSAAMEFMSSPVDAVSGAVGGFVQSMLGTDEVVAAIKENTAAINTLANSMNTGGTEGGNTIVLELNERQLGKAVTGALNKQNQMVLG